MSRGCWLRRTLIQNFKRMPKKSFGRLYWKKRLYVPIQPIFGKRKNTACMAQYRLYFGTSNRTGSYIIPASSLAVQEAKRTKQEGWWRVVQHTSVRSDWTDVHGSDVCIVPSLRAWRFRFRANSRIIYNIKSSQVKSWGYATAWQYIFIKIKKQDKNCALLLSDITTL